jgi:hypothetical protein
MNMKDTFVPASLAAASLLLASPVRAQDLFTGDTRLACEAILCLSSGAKPSECSPSLQRYFGISRRSWRDTVKDRLNFLNLCPAAHDTSQNMPSLVQSIANGAGRCDAAYLNTLTRQEEKKVCNAYSDSCAVETVTVIDSTQPAYCAAYSGHPYVYQIGARYVGEPMNGGHWVDGATGQ